MAPPPESGARARTPLPVFALLSLLLHAAVIGLWPQSSEVPISAPLPAGPVAVRLQARATGGAQAAPAANTVHTRAAERTSREQPQAARPAPPSDQRATIRAATDTTASAVASKAEPTADRRARHENRNAADGAGGAGAAGTDDGEALHAQLHGRLQHALVAHFDYPLLARRRGWEGVVRVGLRIGADGQLSRLHVVGSSGHDLLDRAALNSLHRVGRLPDVAGSMQGRALDMVLPVRYRLIDS